MFSLRVKAFFALLLSAAMTAIYFFVRLQVVERKTAQAQMKRQKHVMDLSTQSAKAAQEKHDELTARIKKLDADMDAGEYPDLK